MTWKLLLYTFISSKKHQWTGLTVLCFESGGYPQQEYQVDERTVQLYGDHEVVCRYNRYPLGNCKGLRSFVLLLFRNGMCVKQEGSPVVPL